MKQKLINQQGLTLIEILLMVVLIGLVAGALAQLSVISIKTSDVSRSRTTANELARQALELARSKRDSDSTAFFALNGYYSIDGNNNFVLQSGACTPPCPDFRVSTDSNSPYYYFFREVRIQPSTPSTNKSTVTVKVFYTQRGVYANVVLQTVLADWR